jgi:hypothetical protein
VALASATPARNGALFVMLSLMNHILLASPFGAEITMGLVLLGPALVVLIIVMFFRARTRNKRAAAKSHGNVKRDWQPTGNINFIVPDDVIDQDKFVLEVEENRVIELLGGGTTLEIRFRLATLDEAKRIVQGYERHIADHPEDSLLPKKAEEIQRPRAVESAV